MDKIENIGTTLSTYDKARIMLDALPTMSLLWNAKIELIDANLSAVRLLGVSSKEELFTHFVHLSPQYQPDGRNSAEKMRETVATAFSQDISPLEWMFHTIKGDLIPSKISFARVNAEENTAANAFIVTHVSDLRNHKQKESIRDEAFLRTRLMLDSMPMCANFWNEAYENIDCNQEAVNLFELSSKQEYLERFFELSPVTQADGKNSAEKAHAMITKAFSEGRHVFEWMHQKLSGEPIPAEITLVRVDQGDGKKVVVGYTRDLRKIKKIESKQRETLDRLRFMLDAMPLSCNFWDENLNNVDCNLAAVKLFELSNKQDFLESFYELSPRYQPDGRVSQGRTLEMVARAFREGRLTFEWMHQKKNGELIPTEISLVRIDIGEGKRIVAGYLRDLRQAKEMETRRKNEDERFRVMLDATPLCCTFWDENLQIVDSNPEALRFFGVTHKKELSDFVKLSPEYQPDGSLSQVKAQKLIKEAFLNGRSVFEWMHQTLAGEPIPAEITLVPIQLADGRKVVVGSARDLREVKDSLKKLNHLEKLAFSDSLTGIYNRRYFLQTSAREFDNNKIALAPLSIIMYDIDFFKTVNDTYGHEAGDDVLKAVTGRVTHALRADDTCARYGGEEFIVLIKNSPFEDTLRLAWRLRDKIADSLFAYKGTKFPVTMSLGIATQTSQMNSVEELIACADKALYQAKNSGRNRVCVYEELDNRSAKAHF